MQVKYSTRKQLVDQVLKVTKWYPVARYRDGVTYSRAAVEEYPTANGPVDCTLFNRGEPAALVESTRLDVGSQNVLQQAQRYTCGLTDFCNL